MQHSYQKNGVKLRSTQALPLGRGEGPSMAQTRLITLPPPIPLLPCIPYVPFSSVLEDILPTPCVDPLAEPIMTASCANSRLCQRDKSVICLPREISIAAPPRLLGLSRTSVAYAARAQQPKVARPVDCIYRHTPSLEAGLCVRGQNGYSGFLSSRDLTRGPDGVVMGMLSKGQGNSRSYRPIVRPF